MQLQTPIVADHKPLVWKRQQIMQALVIGKDTLNDLIKNDPYFPKPFFLGPNRRIQYWAIADIEKWLRTKANDTNATMALPSTNNNINESQSILT